ncbi:MAG TPA: hypothetical protein VGM19_06900 [Armatimonadota bacterium]
MEWFKERLDAAVKSCCSNPERRIGHGNLRHEYSTWRRSGEGSTNVAIIYETPGGSTTQLNITYDPETKTFSYLSHDLECKVDCTDPREVLGMIEDHVNRIPEKREKQLQAQIDIWVGQGMSRQELFAQLNKLLQAEFLGGRITTQELQRGIQYAIRHYAQGSRE